MDNFDLKKYLAEGRLFEEAKTIDVYGDGDVVVDISKATPEQERVINFEFEVSEFSNSEEAQEVVDQIMNLNSAKEVKNYYDNVRGWATVDYLDTYKALNAFVGNKPIAEGRLLKEEIDYSSIKDEMKKIYDIDVDLDTIKDFVTSYNDSEGMDVFDTTEREDFYLYLKDLDEGVIKEEIRDVEDILVKAGFSFDDGILGGVGSGGAGYYDNANDKIYGYNQSGPWNEEEFNKFYDNFEFNSNLYEKEFAEENDDPYDYDMVAQMVKPGIYSIGDEGYVEIRSNGDVEIYAIPQLSDEDGRVFLPAFKMNASGKAIPQFSKDEMRKMLKDDMLYIL